MTVPVAPMASDHSSAVSRFIRTPAEAAGSDADRTRPARRGSCACWGPRAGPPRRRAPAAPRAPPRRAVCAGVPLAPPAGPPGGPPPVRQAPGVHAGIKHAGHEPDHPGVIAEPPLLVIETRAEEAAGLQEQTVDRK